MFLKTLLSSLYYRLLMNHNTSIVLKELPEFYFKASELNLISISTNNIIETPAGFFRLIRKNSSNKQFKKETQLIYSVVKSVIVNDMNGGGYERYCRNENTLRKSSCGLFKYNCFNANRSISQTIIAKFLGQQDLLTHTELCKINVEGKLTLVGTMSAKALGVKYDDVKSDLTQKMTPQLLRALTNYNILDVICSETDHGANNYMNIIDDEGKIQSICSFDNDSPSCFKLSSSIGFVPTAEGRPFVSSDGIVLRPYLDKTIVQKLDTLDVRALRNELSKYLNFMQLHYIFARIKKLTCAIRHSVDKGVVKLLEPDDWTQEMVDKEVAGENGRTYMYVLVDWWNYYNPPK